MPRFFNNTPNAVPTEGINLSGGNALFTFDAITMMAIIRRGDQTDLSQAIIGYGNGTDANRSIMFVSASGVPDTCCRFRSVSAPTGMELLDTDGWALVGVTAAAGATPTPRFVRGIMATNTTTFGNGAATITKPAGTPTNLYLGTEASNNALKGDIAIAGIWDVAFTDQQIQSLMYGLDAWFQVQPRGLWLLDQDATGQKVYDLSGGGANESSLTGTPAISTGASVPFSYASVPIVVSQRPATTAVNDTVVAVPATATASAPVVVPQVTVPAGIRNATASAPPPAGNNLVVVGAANATAAASGQRLFGVAALPGRAFAS
jgi:hypothetical protein